MSVSRRADSFTADNARSAVLAFKGDVYQGLDAENMSDEDLNWGQDTCDSLRSLWSVAPGSLQAYRLEIGKFANDCGADLYQFPGDLITTELNKMKTPVLVNLASNEYFKSVQEKDIAARIITSVFMDKKNDKYKIVSFYAKKARGLMSRYIIEHYQC